ncbi:MAG: nucleotidyltransferase domain-containing protein [Pseudomonadota bacterium]
MDIKQIKVIVIQLRKLLLQNNIKPDLFILYGSYAQGNQTDESDIDIACVSRDFGKNRFKEGSLLNYLISKIDAKIELVPIGLEEYLSGKSISPILNEIIKNGTPLL